MKVVELTEDERDALWAVLYCVVGGSPSGPRKQIDSVMEKLINVGAEQERYTARIETLTPSGSKAIVIHAY